MTVHFEDLRVDWLGYATVRIEGADGTVVYLDPGRYGVLDDYDARDGDVVCVSHVHHYDTTGSTASPAMTPPSSSTRRSTTARPTAT